MSWGPCGQPVCGMVVGSFLTSWPARYVTGPRHSYGSPGLSDAVSMQADEPYMKARGVSVVAVCPGWCQVRRRSRA